MKDKKDTTQDEKDIVGTKRTKQVHSGQKGFYCCNFNGRAVPWAFPLQFVCKSRVESGVQCVTNGAENSIS